MAFDKHIYGVHKESNIGIGSVSVLIDIPFEMEELEVLAGDGEAERWWVR